MKYWRKYEWRTGSFEHYKQAQNNITVYRHNSSFTLPVILSPKVAELAFDTF